MGLKQPLKCELQSKQNKTQNSLHIFPILSKYSYFPRRNENIAKKHRNTARLQPSMENIIFCNFSHLKISGAIIESLDSKELSPMSPVMPVASVCGQLPSVLSAFPG